MGTEWVGEHGLEGVEFERAEPISGDPTGEFGFRLSFNSTDGNVLIVLNQGESESSGGRLTEEKIDRLIELLQETKECFNNG